MSEDHKSLAGALRGVRVAGLAEANASQALAALVLLHKDKTAAQALAGCAADDEAHLWLWRLVTDQGAADIVWPMFGSLPAGLVVPEALRDHIRRYAAAEPPPPPAPMRPQHPELPERLAWPSYLAALDPSDAFSLELFRMVVGPGTTATSAAQTVAAARLASHGEQSDVAVVLAALGGLAPAQQVHVLQAFPAPYGDDVADAVVERVALASQQLTKIDVKDLIPLAGRLDDDRLIHLVSQRSAHLDRLSTLVSHGLVREIGFDRAKVLLESGLADESVKRILDSAAPYVRDDLYAAFAAYVHDRFGDDHGAVFRRRLRSDVDDADRWGHRTGEPRERPARLNLFWVVVLESDSGALAVDLANSLRPGELTAPTMADSDEARRCGRVASGILQRDDANAFEADIRNELMRAEQDGFMSAYLTGLVDMNATKVPDFVFDAAIAAGASAPLAAAGLADRVIERTALLGAEDAPAAQVLQDSLPYLADEQRRRLVALVTWPHVDAATFPALVERLKAEPGTLAVLVEQTLDALGGPEIGRAPEKHLAGLLASANDAGVFGHLSLTAERVTALVGLLMSRHVDLVAAAAVAIGHVEPTTAVVEGVATADQRTGSKQPPIGELRGTLARTLTAKAADAAADHNARADALHLAQTADPPIARAAAFSLASSSDVTLRAAASEVLMTSPGDATDLERLAALLADENVNEIAANLDAARRRLASGDLGEAVHHLFTMLGVAPGTDADVLVPAATGRTATFLKLADDARTRYGAAATDPAPFIDAAILLADLLVDIALVGAHDAPGELKGLKAPQAEAIRANAASRPDTGSLVTQQQLVQRFPWFSHVASLRGMRHAHPAPIGTTTPRERGNDEMVAAKVNLGHIVRGWAETMQQLPHST